MNLAIDIGNTAVKWATFEGHTLKATGDSDVQELEALLGQADKVLACASGELPQLGTRLPVLDANMTMPIRLDYKTPQTLGADRIADACGAWGLHPGEASVIIDAGTCITVDYLDASGVYHGGAIMPGLGMSLQALHTFTAKLPLVDITAVTTTPVLGRSTEESIVAGTLGATMLALAGYVALYKQKSPSLHVLLTGGDDGRLTAAGATGWEHVPHLTLLGLNEIMNHDND